MDTNQQSTLDKFTKELSLLHFALTIGLFLIAAVIYWQSTDMKINLSDTGDFYIYLCPTLAIGGIYVGGMLYTKRVAEAKPLANLEEKLAAYRAATVLKYSLIEGPALIAVIIALDTENLLYMLISICLAFYLYTQKVSQEKIIEELGLSI